MRPGTKAPHLIVSYFIVSALILFVDSRGFLQPVHSLVQKLAIPVESKLFRAREATLGKLGNLGVDKDKKIQEFEQRNASLSSLVAKIGSLQTENEHMRNLLGSDLPVSWRFTPVGIISLQVDSLYVLTSESVFGKPSIWVSTPEPGKTNYGIFLGKVEKVLGQRAEILLPTSSVSKIKVNIKDKESGQKQAMGIVEGRGGRMVLGQVLTGETLKSGDLVVTAGDADIPPDV
ncbi:MAG: hypothetical protein HYW33_00670, partial [Candidatus Blackburnbacteria bacterium]|nr:hypothetical protein [Candidatus Blackburnbacteria bacterium]